MRGMPLLMASRSAMQGPKVPTFTHPEMLLVHGLEGDDYVTVIGVTEHGHVKLVSRVDVNGSHRLYPDDYIGCVEFYAVREGNISKALYVWIE